MSGLFENGLEEAVVRVAVRREVERRLIETSGRQWLSGVYRHYCRRILAGLAVLGVSVSGVSIWVVSTVNDLVAEKKAALDDLSTLQGSIDDQQASAREQLDDYSRLVAQSKQELEATAAFAEQTAQLLLQQSSVASASSDQLGLYVDIAQAKASEMANQKSSIAGIVLDQIESEDMLARITPPIGTIIAYAGVEVPKFGTWLECNGDPLDRSEYEQLWEVLRGGWGVSNKSGDSQFRLPNLSGMFLRGAGPDRPVGGVQEYATAKPVNPLFGVSEDICPVCPYGYDSQTGDRNKSIPDGDRHGRPNAAPRRHDHTIENWDVETRPVNCSVRWLVRAK